MTFTCRREGDPRSQFKELAHKIKRSVERVQAVHALTENEERMRLALDGTREAHCEINIAIGISYISPQGCEMLGYAPEEMQQYKGLLWRNLAHPDDIAKTDAALQDYYNGRSEFFQVQQRLRMKNGEWKWMLVRGRVVEYDSDNHPVRFVGTHTDITEQKEAERELFNAKKDWETIFRAIGNPTLIISADHTVIDANESVLTLTGKRLEEIKGLKCWSLFHEPGTGNPIVGCPYNEMKKSGKIETVVVQAEAFNRFFTSCTPAFDDNGKIVKAIHIVTDITENKQLEENLKESHDY